MKRVFLIGIFILILACNEKPPKPLTAQEIVDKSITDSGGALYEDYGTAFVFRDKKYVSENANGKKVLKRIFELDSTQIMDVNSNTVAQYFNDYCVDTLIHGHTHRPAIHQMDAGRRRIVLGDWRPEPSYLSWKQGHFKLTDSRIS
jgi:hypothetical protein